MTWLGDEVFSVREAAVHNIAKLILLYGSDWARGHIVPRIKDLTSNSNYLHRMTSLYAASVSPWIRLDD
jgi:serine/threonine-protein phosphatase 2A regulatory subunit A